MQNELSEADLAIVHALQLAPRASWSELAPVLDTTPTTLARRWHRLRETGLAWVTAHPAVPQPGAQIALIEVDCAPGRVHDVATTLDPNPMIVTIEHCARGRDLLLAVVARSFADLGELVLDWLEQLPGVVSTRTHLGGDIHLEGSRWRLDALDTEQIERIQGLQRPVEKRPTTHVDPYGPVYAPLTRELGRDGRAGASDLAKSIGRPAPTVRRQLAALIRSRTLEFRCEVAHQLSQRPNAVTWWIRLPAAHVVKAAHELRRDSRVRGCISLVGTSNFLITAWTRSLPDLMQMQHQLEETLPGATIVDTSITLRTRKRLGWLLHPDGRCTGTVIPLVSIPTPPIPGSS